MAIAWRKIGSVGGAAALLSGLLLGAAGPARADDTLYTYRIVVYTGNVNNAGTDANVYIDLYGTKGNQLDISLDNGGDPFERGAVDRFSFVSHRDLGDIWQAQIGHDNRGNKPGWYLDHVEIKREPAQAMTSFANPHHWLAVDEDDHQTFRVLYKQN